jgi:DnaJ-class molecular chaperone
MIALVEDRPQRFWVADECDACHGTGRSNLPRGQFASDGGSTVRCHSCGGEGVTNKRWEPAPIR